MQRSLAAKAIGLVTIAVMLIAGGAWSEEQEQVTPPEKTLSGPEGQATAKAAPAATGSASIAFLNRYIFRGYEVGKSGLVAQPSMSLNFKGFGFAYWSNFDTNQRDTTTATFARERKKGFSETDLILNYTTSINKFSLTGGYAYYNVTYSDDTGEVFVTVTHDGLLKPTLSLYQDVGSHLGTYGNLSFSHSVPLYRSVSLGLKASFGYEAGEGKTFQRSTGAYTGPRYSGFHDGMVEAAFTVPITKAFTVHPFVQYWLPLSANASRTVGRDANGERISYNHNGYVTYNLVGGITFVYGF